MGVKGISTTTQRKQNALGISIFQNVTAGAYIF
jgi:hypothetical protein